MLAAWQMIFGTIPLLVLAFIVDGNPVRSSLDRDARFSAFFISRLSAPR